MRDERQTRGVEVTGEGGVRGREGGVSEHMVKLATR